MSQIIRLQNTHTCGYKCWIRFVFQGFLDFLVRILFKTNSSSVKKRFPLSLYSALLFYTLYLLKKSEHLCCLLFPRYSVRTCSADCLPSERARESLGFVLALEETCILSAVFPNRSVLFLTSGSFNIPHALTNTDT